MDKMCKICKNPLGKAEVICSSCYKYYAGKIRKENAKKFWQKYKIKIIAGSGILIGIAAVIFVGKSPFEGVLEDNSILDTIPEGKDEHRDFKSVLKHQEKLLKEVQTVGYPDPYVYTGYPHGFEKDVTYEYGYGDNPDNYSEEELIDAVNHYGWDSIEDAKAFIREAGQLWD